VAGYTPVWPATFFLTGKTLKSLTKILIVCLSVLFVGACTVEGTQDYPEVGSDKKYRRNLEKLDGGKETLFGDLSVGGPKAKDEGGTTGAVNIFLWRAALETLSLGPLESADPFSGVIITDWFNLEEQPGAQYRVTAYILGRSLRTDNIKIAMYVRAPENGKTLTKRANQTAERRLENLILTKARTIRATQYR
jgi:hypothetical protein